MRNKIIAALLAGLVLISALPVGVSAISEVTVATWGKERISSLELEEELLSQRKAVDLSYGFIPMPKSLSEFYEEKVDVALFNIRKRMVQKQKAKEYGVTPTNKEINAEFERFLNALAIESGIIEKDQVLDPKTRANLLATGKLEAKCRSLYNMSVDQYRKFYITNNLCRQKLWPKISGFLDKKIETLYPGAVEYYNNTRATREKNEKRGREIEIEKNAIYIKQASATEAEKAIFKNLCSEELLLWAGYETEWLKVVKNLDEAADKKYAQNLFAMIEKTVNKENERKWVAQINLNTDGLNDAQKSYVKTVAEGMLKQLEKGDSISSVVDETSQQLLKGTYMDNDQLVAATRILDSLKLHSGYFVYEKNVSPKISELENDTYKDNQLIDKLISLPQGFSITVVEKTVAAGDVVPLECIKTDPRSYVMLRDFVYDQYLNCESAKQKFIKNDKEIGITLKQMVQ